MHPRPVFHVRDGVLMSQYGSVDLKQIQGDKTQNSGFAICEDRGNSPQPVLVHPLLPPAPFEVFFRTHTGTSKVPLDKPDLSHYQLHPYSKCGLAIKTPLCRKPHCSKQCWRHYAAKEQAILTRYLQGHLPKNYPIYFLNCKFAQTIKQDTTARQQITKQVQKLENELGCIIRFRLWLHLTQYGWHYDGLLYTNSEHLNIAFYVRPIFSAHCLKRGLRLNKHVREDGKDLLWLSKYVTKNTKDHVVYLPQKRNHPLHLETRWGSRNWAKQKDRGFYFPTTYDDLWEEVKLTWVS